MWEPQLQPAHGDFKCLLQAAPFYPVMSRVPHIDSSAAVGHRGK